MEREDATGEDRWEDLLAWVSGRAEDWIERLVRWAGVNTGSRNVSGLHSLLGMLREDLAGLGGDVEEVDLPSMPGEDLRGEDDAVPLGRALSIRKRPDAHLRVILAGHLDTVFGPEHPFREVRRDPEGVLRGPGVLDAKGGLAVMGLALEALEKSPWAAGLGWEVLITPDEELGSPGSAPLFARAAARNHLGLVFEPGQGDGALVGARKGSGNFTAVIRGRSAHAGRNPEEGRNAIHALADFVGALVAAGREAGVLVNVGQVAGGEAVNVVPDRAQCRFNVRVDDRRQQDGFGRFLEGIVSDLNRRDGLRVEIRGGFGRPPKVMDARTEWLYEALGECGCRLGLALHWSSSGGASDGNLLAAAGLPTADGLGPRGGGLHTPSEHVVLASLAERARLVALLLLRLGSGDLLWTGE